MMYCPNCGKEIAGGSKFCPKCGFRIANVAGDDVHVTGHPIKARFHHAFAKHRFLKRTGVGIVLALVLLGGSYKYYSAHFIPLTFANQSMTLSNEYSKVHYHFHYRTFTYKPEDEKTQHYSVEGIHKSDSGHKIKADVQGLDHHSNADSFTFNSDHNELSAKPDIDD